ncbi:MAG TPA: zinc ribbon domain-containing protein [Longimicrobiales bacterium]
MNDDVVARLHLALVQALRSRGPGALERPVTVAEIYQDLIPYRTARAVAGVELNADYEHALLRLFAGEGGRVRVEPAAAREELARELESPSPNVSLYRKFAACDAWIAPPAAAARPATAPAPAVAAQSARPPAPAVAAPSPRPPAPGAPPPARGSAPPAPAVPPAAVGAPAASTPAPAARPRVPAAPAPAPNAAGAGPATGTAAPAPRAPTRPEAASTGPAACAVCSKSLPAGRTARFCPHCGADQRTPPCRRCGELLEPGWRYCIGCGAPAGAERRDGAAS